MYKKIITISAFIGITLGVILSVLFQSPSKVFAATATVNLLTTDNFAVLSGSGITDTGTTTITGDVGLSPTGGTAITGLTCTEVTGTIYDTNGGYTGGGGGSTACLSTNAGLLTSAQNDLTTAYTDAANRTAGPDIATELGGSTLTDGVYHAASGTFGLTGTVTLDGQGNADSVFIFKMGSTLTTASSSHVSLINGAQACNVFWQVGSAATLGTSSDFSGNILSTSAITDNGSSTIKGRLLVQTAGAVTLNNTTVTRQTCATPTPTPTPIPGSSPTPTSGSGVSSTLGTGSSAVGGTHVCPVLNAVIPIIIESKRTDPESVFISWGPYAGISTFILRYGLVNGNWLYNTAVTGFLTTIHDIPANQPIWVEIAATDGCSVGEYSEAKLVGGPRLPNTGVANQKPRIRWFILAGFFLGIPLLYVFHQKKLK